MVKTFVLASASGNITNSQFKSGDLIPKIDYIELANKFGGELLGQQFERRKIFHWIRPLERKVKLDLSLALFSASRIQQDGLVLSASEKIAIPLAMLFYFRHNRPKHIVIGHKLSSGIKAKLFQTFQIQKQFDQVICLCRAQAEFAVQRLGLPVDRVHFVYDGVDDEFYYPNNEDQGDYILAVGQEQRDYDTLLRAVKDEKIKLIIVASSPWSSEKNRPDLHDNVEIKRNIPYSELRRLYAGARMVVVPLKNVDYAAGVNTVLEAMAMAKPIILSNTPGICDYAIHDETGYFVTPGNVQEMKDAILRLWSNSNFSNRLGLNARQAIENNMTIGHYVNDIFRIVSTE